MNRDIDAQIVKTIYKWLYIPVSGDYNGENACQVLFPPNKEPTQSDYNTLPLVGKPHEGWFAPKYSGDFMTALRLAKEIKLPILLVDCPMDSEQLAKSCLEYWESTTIKPLI
jgi:hypothetical protein